METGDKIAVVIPCYKVSQKVINVIKSIGPEVSKIYCIDDACPENSGDIIERYATDDRVKVIRHTINGGVGKAVLTGYRQAIIDGAKIIVKLDGDGQMDASFITEIIQPLVSGEADYVKGNRFYNIDSLKKMPKTRIIGNAGLSFLTKMSSGYWNLFDPTNGFTAINSAVANELNFDKIHNRFFFESDMLFHLSLLQAKIIEVPMDAFYSDEKSNLNIWKSLFEFPVYHLKNFVMRIFYNYFLRNFSIASLNLIIGLPLLLFGVIFGLSTWLTNLSKAVTSPAGTVMLSALPIIVGFQMLISFLNYDISTVPDKTINQKIIEYRTIKKQLEK